MSLFKRQNGIIKQRKMNMKIEFIRNDITKIKADVIVNTANPLPVIGGGADSAIYKAADEKKLLAARLKIGNIEPGDARITSGYKLANYIIHTVGPKYIDGHHNEEKILRNCYYNSLKLAKDNQCQSIVFPLIATGVYGYPKEEAISVAVSVISDFIIKENYNIKVIISVFDDESYALCLKIASSMESFIDSNESIEALKQEYGSYYEKIKERQRKIKVNRLFSNNDNRQESFEFSNDTKTFAEMLIFYLNIRNEKASNLYRAVNIDRRLFSKILNNDYHPSKDTVIRMCIGLRLTLNQSVDLLSRADYAFNPSKAMDLVIMRGISENKSFFEIKDDLEKAGIHIWN